MTGSGGHALKWRYVKDYGGTADSDCGWVDLVQWTGRSPSTDPNDWEKITYKYDISGRRINKTVDGYKTTYCYDGGHVLAEYDGNGNILRKYVYGPRVDEPVCMIEVAAPPSVAHWKFDEGSGATAYDSAGSNDGTIYGATWTTGKLGGALEFDGTNDYVDCGNDTSLEMGTDDWTVSSWIKFDSTTTINPIVFKGGTAPTVKGYNFWYYANDNDLRFYISDGSTRLYGNSNNNLNLDDSQWHFVAASVDRSSNVVFYVDGENVGGTDISSLDGHDVSNPSFSLLIGKWGSNYFDGKIDDVRIYDVALSADEIEHLYDQGQSSATYYYHFDGLGSVVALSDSAGDTVQTYEYSVYGQVAASDPNHPNPYLFTGRRFDRETGLYYYRARYYNPYIGRFMQTDPVGYSAGMNWYLYCKNNPLAYVDPFGLGKWGLDFEEDEEGELTFHIYEYDPCDTYDFIIVGDEGAPGAATNAIENLWELPTGRELLEETRHMGIIIDVRPGTGHDAYGPDTKTIIWDPELDYCWDGSEDWMWADAYILLGHELIHAYHHVVEGMPLEIWQHSRYWTMVEERRTIGIFWFGGERFTENQLREEAGFDPRPQYYRYRWRPVRRTLPY